MAPSPARVRRGPNKEKRDAVRAAPASLRLRRAGAPHRRADDADPPRQAPPDLRGQPQQGALGHRVGRPAARSRCSTILELDPRGQADGRPQQRRRPRQPLALLGDHEPGRRRRADRRRWPRRSTTPSSGFDELKAADDRRGLKRFGSGWSWLAHDGTGLVVLSTPNQDTPAHGRPHAAARRRRLGARLLPEATRTGAPTTSRRGGTSSTGGASASSSSRPAAETRRPAREREVAAR